MPCSRLWRGPQRGLWEEDSKRMRTISTQMVNTTPSTPAEERPFDPHPSHSPPVSIATTPLAPRPDRPPRPVHIHLNIHPNTPSQNHHRMVFRIRNRIPARHPPLLLPHLSSRPSPS